ncbi:hypothetical protein ABZV93_15975 [Actinopolymorpha sp. NPDC004070]|uniref:hypothetical protein n=1 Tax=Actinopolymorpha sp. NPDC004070 TaxID=3154548 RepID=UPI0033B7A85E
MTGWPPGSSPARGCSTWAAAPDAPPPGSWPTRGFGCAVVEDAGFKVLQVRDHTYAPASTEADPETQLFVYARR